MKKFMLFMPFVFLTLTNCATLTSGTSQSILVDVLNIQGADCVGMDAKGRKYVWKDTPTSATVQKGDGPMTLICEKEGFKRTTVEFDETLTGATLGNLIIGGGIGILVDTMSGAAQEYEGKVQLVMEPLNTASDGVKAEYEKWKQKLEETKTANEEGKIDE